MEDTDYSIEEALIETALRDTPRGVIIPEDFEYEGVIIEAGYYIDGVKQEEDE